MSSFVVRADVKLTEEDTFENFVSQFQQHTEKILCVLNGSSLLFFQKQGPFPSGLRFDYKQKRNGITEYYFRDVQEDNLYCVFTREIAELIYPTLDKYDPPEQKKKLLDSPDLQKKREPRKSQEIIIVHKGKEIAFSDIDYPVEIKTHHLP